jgi:transitional endoplasmic reticulum ATPase
MLLAGPPGTGKTLLAKAVANELDRTFLSVKGPELKHPLYGMSERNVRELFETADEEAPCVIFFDEVDAIAGDRDAFRHGATESIVATLLTELDGIESRDDLLVLAATNRPEAIDDAVLRRGRLDEIVDVPVPDADAQAEIFTIHSEPLPVADAVTPEWFVPVSPAEITGADIAGICKQAFERAVSDTDDKQAIQITRAHVRSVLDMGGASPNERTTKHGFE